MWLVQQLTALCIQVMGNFNSQKFKFPVQCVQKYEVIQNVLCLFCSMLGLVRFFTRIALCVASNWCCI